MPRSDGLHIRVLKGKEKKIKSSSHRINLIFHGKEEKILKVPFAIRETQ